MTNETENAAQKANSNRTVQTIWTILIVVFAVVIVLNLYNWTQGKENLRGILSPLGMIFVGAGAIIRPRNPKLSYVFTGIALVLVLTGLILMFVY
jgi:UDP-N-acetylmuramyl pentapeptide phosphotransferase/UDP-N-acetylglucosamine-1-phosphate transferase